MDEVKAVRLVEQPHVASTPPLLTLGVTALIRTISENIPGSVINGVWIETNALKIIHLLL